MRRCFIIGQKETAIRIAREPVRMVAKRKDNPKALAWVK